MLGGGFVVPWFFADEETLRDNYLITGEDARHIEKSLRMKKGEQLTLVTSDGMENNCEVAEFLPQGVKVTVRSKEPCKNESDVRVTLYQSLTKGDKMDMIIQKAVELGVYRIVPVLTARCISRPDEKQLKKKIERWQKIALGAASQSCRGIVPQVCEVLGFKEALQAAKGTKALIFYEGGGGSLSSLVDRKSKEDISIFIGSEGGLEKSEVELARELGVVPATLGRRILRTETAPLAALSAIMVLSGNMD